MKVKLTGLLIFVLLFFGVSYYNKAYADSLVTLSGRVLDAQGNGLPYECVNIGGSSGSGSSATDASGNYSIQVPTGSYFLSVNGSDCGGPFGSVLTAPDRYDISSTSPISLTQDTTLDLSLPLKKVDIHVQDSSGNPVQGIGIDNSQANETGLAIGWLPAQGVSYYADSRTTDSFGNITIWLFPTNSNTYSIDAAPETSDTVNKYQTSTLNNVSIIDDTSLTITMHLNTVTLSGRVLDSLGNPVPNQCVNMGGPSGASGISVTDSSGNYSLQAVPGNYFVTVADCSTNNYDLYSNPNVPEFYSINNTSPIALTQNTTLDLSLPLKKVNVHVQDLAGNPVSGIGIDTNQITQLDLQLANLPANGDSYYGDYHLTDANGNLTIWLFPSDSVSKSYELEGQPETTNTVSKYRTGRLETVNVTSDMSVTIIMPNLNNSPVVNSILSTTLNEGGIYTAASSFTDSDSTSWIGTVDYGDGGGIQPLTLNSDKTFNLAHQYKEEGSYTVTVTVADNQGATGQASATITVNDVNPTVSLPSPSANPVQVNTAVTFSSTFSDPGTSDTYTATWNWGDTTPIQNGTVNQQSGSTPGTVIDSHTYTNPGVYTVTLTVTDGDGGSTTQIFQYLSVYNPTSQGIFSAGSRFTSPQGAYITNSSLTGDVKFGLSYKYQGTMPVGDKQFTMKFDAANLTFNATSVSSLVIANGIGTLKGIGTINGSGTYNFLITGSETNNSIRVQITDSSNNVIYDTQPGDQLNASPITTVNGHVLAH